MNRRVAWATILSSFVTLVCGTWVESAYAQQVAGYPSSSDSSLEEVTVTATRREQREQDVPISLTAYGQQALDTLGVNAIDDLARLTPGVTFIRNGTSGTSAYNDEGSDINIRGIDSTAGAATTGIYIDDTPIQSRKIGFGTQNAYPAVFDLDRVEVLRGPQGTLFGASSEGGTVRFIQPEPSLVASSGYFKSELGFIQNGKPSYEIGAATGGPVIDDVLGFRVSASVRHDGGWVDRVDPNTQQVVDSNSNWHETVTARVAFKWKPVDTLSITPSFYYQRLAINDTTSFWPQFSNPSAEIFRNGDVTPTNSYDPFYIAALRVDWTLPWAQLVSNSSFYSRDQHGHSDFTEYLNEIYLGNTFPAPGTAGSGYLTDNQQNIYQEIRLQSLNDSARVSWTAGVFFARTNENSIENITDPTINAATGGAVCAQFACPGGQIYSEPYNRVIDEQFAIYGEAVLRLTDTLRLTGGVRVSHDVVEGSSLVGGPFLGQATIVSRGSTSENPVTPKAVLSWQPDRDNLVYASAAKGFRPGGINSGVGEFCAANLAALGIPVGPNGERNAPGSYQSDSLWSYEVGAKNAVLNQRLQINSSVFMINWSHLQQNVILGECGLEYTGNLGYVRSLGGDVALLMRPLDSLSLTLTAAYLDARYTETSCATNAIACTGPNATAAPVVSEGDRLIGAPWSFTGMAEYVFAPLYNTRPYLHLDYTYSTAQTGLLPYQDARNAVNDPTQSSLPNTKDLSLRGGLRWAGIDLSVFGQNILDQHPVLFENRDYAAQYVQIYWQRSVQPRTIGLTATYRF